MWIKFSESIKSIEKQKCNEWLGDVEHTKKNIFRGKVFIIVK